MVRTSDVVDASYRQLLVLLLLTPGNNGKAGVDGTIGDWQIPNVLTWEKTAGPRAARKRERGSVEGASGQTEQYLVVKADLGNRGGCLACTTHRTKNSN